MSYLLHRIVIYDICSRQFLHSEGPDTGHGDDHDDAEYKADPQDPLVIRAEFPENYTFHSLHLEIKTELIPSTKTEHQLLFVLFLLLR